MKNAFGILLLGAAAFLFYKLAQSRALGMSLGTVTFKEPLPAGAKLTGRIEQTSNTEPPNGSSEVVGFAIKNWAEVITPMGEQAWVEVQVA